MGLYITKDTEIDELAQRPFQAEQLMPSMTWMGRVKDIGDLPEKAQDGQMFFIDSKSCVMVYINGEYIEFAAAPF